MALETRNGPGNEKWPTKSTRKIMRNLTIKKDLFKFTIQPFPPFEKVEPKYNTTFSTF